AGMAGQTGRPSTSFSGPSRSRVCFWLSTAWRSFADRWREAAKLIGIDIVTMPGVAVQTNDELKKDLKDVWKNDQWVRILLLTCCR
ncbi:hypothetical protein FK513_28340, partial [Klebsiella pneumoniae]|nr:hypothetical protein [Klebsiella pneumoniae]